MSESSYTPLTKHCDIEFYRYMRFLLSKDVRERSNLVPIVFIDGPSARSRVDLGTYVSRYYEDYGFRVIEIKHTQLYRSHTQIRCVADMYWYASMWIREVYEPVLQLFVEDKVDVAVVHGYFPSLVKRSPQKRLYQQPPTVNIGAVASMEALVSPLATYLHPADMRYREPLAAFHKAFASEGESILDRTPTKKLMRMFYLNFMEENKDVAPIRMSDHLHEVPLAMLLDTAIAETSEANRIKIDAIKRILNHQIRMPVQILANNLYNSMKAYGMLTSDTPPISQSEVKPAPEIEIESVSPALPASEKTNFNLSSWTPDKDTKLN